MIKKILLIFIILFTISGCADYKELNTLSYITGIGYDYYDDMYEITYEVMDNKKDGQSVETNAYVVTGTGNSTYEAHVDAARKLNKTAYFLHSQVVILTDNIIEEKLLDVMDSIIRNPKLNEEFLLVITKENTPKEIFETTTDAWPCASFYLYSLIKDNEYSMNYYIDLPFAIFTEKINAVNIDPVVSIIETNGEEIILDGAYLFSDNTPTFVISDNDSNLYNALINNTATIPIIAKYSDYTIEVASKITHVTINVTDDSVNLDLDIISEIKKSDYNIDLFDNEVYKNIADSIAKELEEKIIPFIKILQENNADVLGLSNEYFISNRTDNDGKWLNSDIIININSTISRKGIIYNVG